MHLIRGSRLALIAGVLSACSDPSAPGGQTLDQLPRQLSAAEQKVVAGSNQFSFDFFRAVNARQREENVFISPLSASMALGMALNGAAGVTWEEMRSALRLDAASQQEVNEGFRDLIALLRQLDPQTELGIANSIWYRQGFPFHASFLNESAGYFDAEVSGLNFDDVPASLATINSWVNSATRSRIPTILDAIRNDDVMFLINAIYFKGRWEKRFDPANTSPGAFNPWSGPAVQLPFMRQASTLRYAAASGYQALDLRYGNSAFSMTVLLPTAGRDVNQLIESLDQSAWTVLLDSFGEREVDLALPRFRMEWESGLIEVLQELGMIHAFVPDGADFTRMSPAGSELYINLVKQKSFLEVNEEGTEAAAATIVGVGVTSAPVRIPFVVDRPFVLVIRERFSGTILFMGKIGTLSP
jgi:serine protease inhibitor